MSDRITNKVTLVRNTAANYIMKVWVGAVFFFMFPFIVRKLGIEAAGVWILVSSITGYFGILGLGIGPSLVKFVAQYRAESNFAKLNQVITTTFLIYLLLGGLASAGMFLLGFFFIDSFNIPPALIRDAQIITYLSGLTILLSFPMGVFGSVLRGHQRYDLSNMAGFLVSIPNVVLTLYFLHLGYGIVALTVINSITSMLGWAVNVFFAKRLLPSLRIRISLFRKSMVGDLWSLALALFVVNICMIVIYPTDKLIIGEFLTVGLIVFYEASFKIYRMVEQFPMQLAMAMTPAASELQTHKDYDALRKLYIRGTKYSMALFLSTAIPVMLLSDAILAQWMGEEFREYYLLVVVFISYLFFRYNDLFAYYLLVGMNKVRFLMWFYVVSAVTNICLSLLLVQKIGVLGVVLGTAIPYCLFEPVMVWYNLRQFRVTLWTYCKQVLLKTYPAALIVTAVSYAVSRTWVINSLWEVAVIVAGLAAMYMLFFLFLGMLKEERREAFGLVFRVFGKEGLSFNKAKEETLL